VSWSVILLSIILFVPRILQKTDKKFITIFTWGDILEPAALQEFQKKTGIDIKVSYYASNEELLMKLKATAGEGYDLIIPSDYAVHILRQDGLLKKLDYEKLTFKNDLNPLLMNHYFDPNNEYSLPWGWEIFGFGYDRDVFGTLTDVDWDLIFDTKKYAGPLIMINDPREAVAFASLYLFGSNEALNNEQKQAIIKLLLQQKDRVMAYSNFRADYYLATKNCPLVVSSSSYIWRAIQQYPHIGFAIPKKTFITIENMAITSSSEHEEYIYEFLNFIFQKDIVQQHFDAFAFIPSRTDAIEALPIHTDEKMRMISSAEEFKRYHFFTQQLSELDRQTLWMTVKS
jgi:spermidine/putrescine transport system substrate-binding protein